jgi:hypothetical protein
MILEYADKRKEVSGPVFVTGCERYRPDLEKEIPNGYFLEPGCLILKALEC